MQGRGKFSRKFLGEPCSNLQEFEIIGSNFPWLGTPLFFLISLTLLKARVVAGLLRFENFLHLCAIAADFFHPNSIISIVNKRLK
jgi:hypothetical protein